MGWYCLFENHFTVFLTFQPHRTQIFLTWKSTLVILLLKVFPRFPIPFRVKFNNLVRHAETIMIWTLPSHDSRHNRLLKHHATLCPTSSDMQFVFLRICSVFIVLIQSSRVTFLVGPLGHISWIILPLLSILIAVM